MKNIALYIIFFTSLFVLANSCYDDKSTYPTTIPDIMIDTTGIPVRLVVRQNENLLVNPKVSREGSDSKDFSYEWKFNLIATSTVTDRSNFIVLSNEEIFNVPITVSPSNTTYFLWLTVTDNSSGLSKDMLWNVLVQSAYNEGLLIAETYDGKTTDLALIEGKLFTSEWTGEDVIQRNIYSENNGAPFPGVFKDMWIHYNNRISSKRLWAVGDDFLSLIDGTAFELVGVNEEVIVDYRVQIKPDMVFHTAWGYMVFVNDGDIYPWERSPYSVDYPSLKMPSGYSLQKGEELLNLEFKVDNYIAYTHNLSSDTTCWGVWYDKQNGIFMGQLSSPQFNRAAVTLSHTDNEPFDPDNCPNLETLFAGVSLEDDFYMIMRNTTLDSYHIYVIDRYKSSAKALYDIPGEEIRSAKHFIISENSNVVYFATEKDLYSIVLTSGTPRVNHLYTIPSGEVTTLSMFREFNFLNDPRFHTNPMDSHEYTLLLGGANGYDGTLYAIPILSASGGSIDVNGIVTYPGFGRILSIRAQP